MCDMTVTCEAAMPRTPSHLKGCSERRRRRRRRRGRRGGRR